MTHLAKSSRGWRVTSGPEVGAAVTHTPDYVRVAAGGVAGEKESPTTAVESGRARAVLDVRVDGTMRFSSDGTWDLWTGDGGVVTRHYCDSMCLHENIRGSWAVMVEKGFAADSSWVTLAALEGVGDCPAILVTSEI